MTLGRASPFPEYLEDCGIKVDTAGSAAEPLNKLRLIPGGVRLAVFGGHLYRSYVAEARPSPATRSRLDHNSDHRHASEIWGRVFAPDEATAIAKAIEEYGITKAM
jgi:hypothetical protein